MSTTHGLFLVTTTHRVQRMHAPDAHTACEWTVLLSKGERVLSVRATKYASVGVAQ